MFREGDLMYKIIYMKADFEPWWQFDEWEEYIVHVYDYKSKNDYEDGKTKIFNDFREKYEHEAEKDGKFYAFWKEDEIMYCEGCDDDAQLYHGLILIEP